MNIEDIMNDPERVMPSVRDALQAHTWVPHSLAHLHIETEGCDIGWCTIRGLRIKHANPGAQKFYQVDRQQADIILDLRDHVRRMEDLIRGEGPRPIKDVVRTVLRHMDKANAAKAEPAPLPAGEYCIVELMGHTTMVGRYAEVDRFGCKMLALEPLLDDVLLPAVYHNGTAIFRLTPCSVEQARASQPRSLHHLPAAVQAIVPQPSRAGLLAAFDADEAPPF